MDTFLTLFNTLPAVIAAVQAVETAIPMPQSGKHKLDLVLSAVEAAWEISHAEQSLTKNETLNGIAALVSLTVSTLNAAGVFAKTGPVSSN
jgi:hypothetical protein